MKRKSARTARNPLSAATKLSCPTFSRRSRFKAGSIESEPRRSIAIARSAGSLRTPKITSVNATVTSFLMKNYLRQGKSWHQNPRIRDLSQFLPIENKNGRHGIDHDVEQAEQCCLCEQREGNRRSGHN